MSWKDGAEDECYERYLKEQKSGASMSTNAKSIAERIIEFNENDELRQLWGTVGRYEQIDQLSIELAKAYLELVKKYYELGEEEIQNTVHLENHLMEIQKRGEEITKLEEKNAGLVEALKELSKSYFDGNSNFVSKQFVERIDVARAALKKWGVV